jgi:hypothetical protein
MTWYAKKSSSTFKDQKIALAGLGVVSGRMNLNKAIEARENDPYDRFEDDEDDEPYDFWE